MVNALYRKSQLAARTTLDALPEPIASARAQRDAA
jgi:hypothetical protein